MKIKKLFFWLPFINLLFIGCKCNDCTIDYQKIKNLEAEIHQDTPLQFATRTLRSQFNIGHFDGQIQSPENATNNTEIFSQSFLHYIKNIYNKPYYSEILSQDGTHVIEFLKLCNELSLDTNSVYVGMRLFRIKMMSCEIIDDTVVSQLLEELSTQTKRYFEKSNRKDQESNVLSKHIEKIILGHLNDRFLNSAEALDKVQKALSSEISKLVFDEMKKAKDKKANKKSKTRLRFEIIRFFETVLARMLWNPKAPETIWPSFLSIANGLQRLAANDIVNHMDDLDGLLWELVHRFNFFLDLSGFSLPLNFYTEIENALEEKTIFFLESPEQDDGVRSKKELLAENLFHAKTKAYAFHKKGIIPQL